MTLDRVVSRRSSVENSPAISIGARLAPSEDPSIAPDTAVSRAIPTILRLPSVQAETGYSRSAIGSFVPLSQTDSPATAAAASCTCPQERTTSAAANVMTSHTDRSRNRGPTSTRRSNVPLKLCGTAKKGSAD